MTTEPLKACPWCGKEPKSMAVLAPHPRSPDTWRVWCCARMDAPSEAEAIRTWNDLAAPSGPVPTFRHPFGQEGFRRLWSCGCEAERTTDGHSENVYCKWHSPERTEAWVKDDFPAALTVFEQRVMGRVHGLPADVADYDRARAAVLRLYEEASK